MPLSFILVVLAMCLANLYQLIKYRPDLNYGPKNWGDFAGQLIIFIAAIALPIGLLLALFENI